MPEGDGEEMVCHLKTQSAEFGDVFAKVTNFLILKTEFGFGNLQHISACIKTANQLT